MAGSYGHVIDKRGNLLDSEAFSQMIENLGDAYEACEEMYGMIWYLASHYVLEPKASIADAQINYKAGLKFALEENGRAS